MTAASPGLTVGALLRRVASEAPDRVALVAGDPDPAARRRWTYRELLDDATRVARALLRQFPIGSHIAVWAPNVPEYQVLEYGVALAGMTLVTVNPAYQPGEARFVLEDSEAVAVFAVAEFRGRRLIEQAEEFRREVTPLRLVVDLEHWEDWIATADDAATGVLPPVDGEASAFLLYTSGTTGRPKGALLRHASTVANVTVGAANIAGSAAHRTVWLSTLPMFHLAGAVVAAVGTLSLRGTLVVMRNWDDALAVDLVEQENVSTANIVPTLMWRALARPDFAARARSVHSIMLGGAPIPPELARRVRQLGIVPIAGYGLTEAPMVSQTREGDSDRDLIETIGLPLPGVEMRIADPDDRPLPPGRVGEIHTRGAHTFAGYWHNPEATAAAYAADGWLRTGDLGVMDDRGVTRIAGRAKEMIIRGGENVYPREIEDRLLELPGVLDAAVIGLPDDHYGEVVAAFVRRDPDQQPGVEALVAALRAELTGYKVPSRWFFVEEYPLTASGKIQKFQLLRNWEDGAYQEASA
jgi:fatty-acyl-CoA synthase